MQRLQREGRVAHPRVAVVPVALPARRLGQRRRQRGHRRAGRHVRQPLDRERRPLDRLAEAVVRDPGAPEPAAPEAVRGRDPRLCLLDVLGSVEPFCPGEDAVRAVAGVERVAPADAVALDAQGEVRDQSDRQAGGARVGHVPAPVDERPLGRRAAVVEDRLADELDLDGALGALDRADQHVVAVVVGGRPRVRRDLVLVVARPHRQRVANHDPAPGRLPRRHQHVRARLVRPRGGMVDPERRQPEEAGLAVEQAAEDARRVEGRDAQPVDRPVRGDERARVAVREERVVGDRRERRRCRGALRRRPCVGRSLAHSAIQGPCQLPWPATRALALLGAPRAGRVGVHRRRGIQQRLEHPPRLLDGVLAREAHRVADERRVQEHLVRRRALASLLGELDVELDAARPAHVGPVRVDDQPDARARIELDDELVRLGHPRLREDLEPRRVLEDEPELGLRDGKALAGTDEERHTGPAPVLDVEPKRSVGLGRRIGIDALDVEVAVVLPAHVVRRIGGLDRAKGRDERVLERLRIGSARRLHRRCPDDLHQVVHDDVPQGPDGVVEVSAILDAEVLRHRDLDGLDVVPVPDRLEQRVREPEIQDLLRPHLPEVVVDPVELRLVEVLMELVRERARRLEVVAEGLLHDDPRMSSSGRRRPAPGRPGRTGRAGSRGRRPVSRRP